MTRSRKGACSAVTLLGLAASSVYSLRSYGEVAAGFHVQGFGGIPFAFLVLLWYGLILALLSSFEATGQEAKGAASTLYLYWVSVLGAAPGFFLMTRLFVGGNARCIVCWTSYVPLVILFLVAPPAVAPWSRPRGAFVADLRQLRGSTRGVLLASLLSSLAAAGFLLFGATARSRPTGADGAIPPADLPQLAFREWWRRQPRVPLAERRGETSVVVMKFHDYQCPACGEAFGSYRPVVEHYAREKPGRVSFVPMDFPLEPECNVAVDAPLHPLACEMAVAVRLGARRGSRESLEEHFFSLGQSATADATWQVLRGLGVQGPDDSTYRELVEQIRTDTELGRELGVTVTPTLFVAGVKLSGLLSVAQLRAAIEMELSHQPGGAQ